MRIGPHETIPDGTPVRVGSRRGKVIKSEQVRDQHGGPIMLHTIEFTERVKWHAGRTFWVPMTPKTEQPNYSAIYVL